MPFSDLPSANEHQKNDVDGQNGLQPNNKVGVVALADAVVDKRTVMVEASDAVPANGAMLRASGSQMETSHTKVLLAQSIFANQLRDVVLFDHFMLEKAFTNKRN